MILTMRTFNLLLGVLTTLGSVHSTSVVTPSTLVLSPCPTETDSAPPCTSTPTRLALSDPPYENYFHADCHLASHVVVTSPLEDSNLTFIGPRLIVAWASGNSGILAFFQPQNGNNGTLSIELAESSSGELLDGVYQASNNASRHPTVGVSGFLTMNSPAFMSLAVLGSIRHIRDFTEGPSIVNPDVQAGNQVGMLDGSGAYIKRLWFDNVTTTQLLFTPVSNESVTIDDEVLKFGPGTYQFNATFDYPQLEQLSPMEVFKPEYEELEDTDQAISLSFLSYTDKLLAGTWRFLTYFGRDTLISMLLLQPVLSEGEDSAIEAVISAALERLNATDGSVAHEETLGDYATYLNAQEGIVSTDPTYDYKMIDTDFFLPVAMEDYFVKTLAGQSRINDFLALKATVDPEKEAAGLTYADLVIIAAEKIMNITAAFAQPGGQIRQNMIHLKAGEVVGQWRDSGNGLGGGNIPYDVNTALVPAALRSISALAAQGFYPTHPEWADLASEYADVWEDQTLAFFEVFVTKDYAQSLVNTYVFDNQFPFPSQSQNITKDITFYAVALQGTDNQDYVRVMHTDDCFRLFLLNSTNQSQLSHFLDQVSEHILLPFPAGLSMEAGIIVANPAYGGDPSYYRKFAPSQYHGPVIWSWQLAMLAAGFERQLDRCNGDAAPDFCRDETLHAKITSAYNRLWDLIEANTSQLSGEVWGWVYRDGEFVTTPLGALPPPQGETRPESNIRQLWSLSFLAVKRNYSFR